MSKRIEKALQSITARFIRGERVRSNTTDTAEADPSRCPTCAGAVEVVEGEQGPEYSATMTADQIALALDNEAVARAVNARLTPALRLAVAGVLLQGEARLDGYFTVQDVEDEAEAGLRSLDVANQLAARQRLKEAGHFRGLSERHQKRAIRITALLTAAEQQVIKERVHGGPIGANTPDHIKIVTH